MLGCDVATGRFGGMIGVLLFTLCSCGRCDGGTGVRNKLALSGILYGATRRDSRGLTGMTGRELATGKLGIGKGATIPAL